VGDIIFLLDRWDKYVDGAKGSGGREARGRLHIAHIRQTAYGRYRAFSLKKKVIGIVMQMVRRHQSGKEKEKILDLIDRAKR
jgi:hypothetical protein